MSMRGVLANAVLAGYILVRGNKRECAKYIKNLKVTSAELRQEALDVLARCEVEGCSMVTPCDMCELIIDTTNIMIGAADAIEAANDLAELEAEGIVPRG